MPFLHLLHLSDYKIFEPMHGLGWSCNAKLHSKLTEVAKEGSFCVVSLK